MKSHLRKITRILDAELKLDEKESGLTFRGNNWQAQRNQQERIDKKKKEYSEKLSVLKPLVTEEEFYEHFSERLCCDWEDFMN